MGPLDSALPESRTRVSIGDPLSPSLQPRIGAVTTGTLPVVHCPSRRRTSSSRLSPASGRDGNADDAQAPRRRASAAAVPSWHIPEGTGVPNAPRRCSPSHLRGGAGSCPQPAGSSRARRCEKKDKVWCDREKQVAVLWSLWWGGLEGKVLEADWGTGKEGWGGNGQRGEGRAEARKRMREGRRGGL